jgi:hypothetical protein
MAEFLDCITKVIVELEKSLLASFCSGTQDEQIIGEKLTWLFARCEPWMEGLATRAFQVWVTL